MAKRTISTAPIFHSELLVYQRVIGFMMVYEIGRSTTIWDVFRGQNSWSNVWDGADWCRWYFFVDPVTIPE